MTTTATNGHSNGIPRRAFLMATHCPLSAVKGALYQFAGVRDARDPMTGEQPWAFPPSVYRCLGVARSYRLAQDMVVYEGAGNDYDHGNMWLASLSDWEAQFKLIEATEPEATAAEKVAGVKEGSGV